jgi:hypothetical protein
VKKALHRGSNNEYKKHPSKLNLWLKDLKIEMKRVNISVKGSIGFNLYQNTITASLGGTAGKL